MSKPKRSPEADRRAELAIVHMLRKDGVTRGIITEDAYRATVASVLDEHENDYDGEPSSRYLGPAGRARLIALLRALGCKTPNETAAALRPGHGTRKLGTWRGRYYGGGEPFLTQAQADKIAQQEDILHWTSTSARLTDFLIQQTNRRCAVQMLTGPEATDVITGLQVLTGERNPDRDSARSRQGAMRRTHRRKQKAPKGFGYKPRS